TGFDLDTPRLVTSAPLSNAFGVARDVQPSVTFDEPIDPTSLAGVRLIKEYYSGITVPAQVSLSNAGMTISASPLSPLDGSTTYSLVIDGSVVDLGGNSVGGSFYGVT